MFKKFLGVASSALLLGFVACSDDNPSVPFVEPNAGESSSSIEPAPGSSETADDASSSSVASVSSSSADALVDPTACLWNGKKGESVVNTGFGLNAESGAGYWYSYDDSDDGGLSHIVWDVDCPNDGTDCMQYIVDHCGGLCGKMYVKKGTAREANVGVAFNVAGFENPGESVEVPKSVDISDWGGICVTFASSLNLFMKLGVDENTEVIVELGQSDDLVEECFTWNDFDYDDAENPIPGAEAAKKVRNIKFGIRSGESMIGPFKIVSIGKYVAGGSCKVVASNPNSSSSMPSSSGDCVTSKVISNMWYAPEAVGNYNYRVETGIDNGSEVSGYWFSFGDEPNAKIVFPISLEYTYVADEDPVMDYCEGVCGMLEFKNTGVAGVGFNIAGEIINGSYTYVAFGDASSWGGVCVTYASESDMDVVMFSDTTTSFAKKVAIMPRILLPKSVEVNTVCSKWNDFATYAETPGNPAHFNSILFVTYGEAGLESRFNIIGVGKYVDAQNVCKQGEDPFVSGKKGMIIQ